MHFGIIKLNHKSLKSFLQKPFEKEETCGSIKFLNYYKSDSRKLLRKISMGFSFKIKNIHY